MPLQIASFLIPKNGLSFYLIEDIYLKGGMQVMPSTQERDAIPETSRKAGMLVYTVADEKFWQLRPDMLTWILPPGLSGTQGEKGEKGDPGYMGINAAGEFVDRSTYDASPQGFIFLSIGQNLLYVKLSGIVGDWSPGIPFGIGSKGDQGEKGDPGAASVVPGPRGAEGPAGKDSVVPGPRGAEGPAGKDGVDGAPGAPGADSTVAGPAGKDGADGAPGKDGVDGAPGKDGATAAHAASHAKGAADAITPAAIGALSVDGGTVTDLEVTGKLGYKAEYATVAAAPAPASHPGMVITVLGKPMVSVGGEYVPLAGASYDCSFFVPGLMPVADELVGAIVLSRPVKFPVGLTGSVARCRVAPTVTVTYAVKSVDATSGAVTSRGTVTFNAGSKVGAFALAAELALVAGDQLQLVTPSAVDATIADVAVTLVGKA